MQSNPEKFNCWFVILITISSVNQWTNLPIGNTFLWWIIYTYILFIFIRSKRNLYNPENNISVQPILVFLIWNLVCIIRGAFIADNYWEWKNLVTVGLVLLLPLSIYITTNKDIVQRIMSFWFYYALPLFFVLVFFFNDGIASGRYLVPVSFLAITFPLVPPKWRIAIVICCVVVMFSALDARSNVIKYGISLLAGATYLMKDYIHKSLFSLGRSTFLFLPIILFGLGCSGIFNIFKMDEYLGDKMTVNVTNRNETTEEDLAADTRTGLYEEVIASAVKYKYSWFGRTPARGNESDLFGDYALEVLKITKKERYANEVSILNIFTWTGITGVILYFLIFYQASYLAIHKSNNTVMKIMGLCVAFRWLYAWVEDFSEFDLSYFFLWIMIGMCFSKSFRDMTDLDFKYWIWGIFYKEYRYVYAINLPTIDKPLENLK